MTRTILVVSHEASRSGAPAVAVNILDALSTNGAATKRVLIHRWGGPFRAEMDRHADVALLEPLARTRVALRRFRRTRKLAVRVEEWAAGRVLDRVRPQLVWCNTVLSASYVNAARNRRIPVVLHAHENRSDIERLLRRYDVAGTGAAGVTLVGCAARSSAALASVVGALPDAATILHSAIDVDAVDGDLDRTSRLRGGDGADVRIMGCGQDLAVKGADRFAELATRVRAERARTSFTWIGGAPGTFPPGSPTVHISTIPNAAAHLAGGDIFVLSSRDDQFPLVVLEAMARGLVIVAFDVGDVAEQLGDTGVLVPSGDIEAMQAAVIALVDDPARRARLAAAARDRVADRWGLDRFADSVRAIADRAVAGAPPLCVLHLLWRLGASGGIQVVVRSIVTGVDPSAVSFNVATVRPAVAADDLDGLPANVTMHPLGFAEAVSAVDDARIVRRFASLVRRLRPDVVHLHSGTAWLGGLALLLVGRSIPVVFEVHDAPGNGRHATRTEALEGRLARRRRWWVVTHAAATKREVESAWRITPDRSVMFPLGIAVDRFRPFDPAEPSATGVRRAWRDRYGVPPSAVVAICVARLVPSKRVDLLLDALSALDRAGTHLVLVGDGPEGERLRTQASQLGVAGRVSFVGGLDHADVPSALAACDLAVSASGYEGFGLTIVEAMAAGLPVVATGVGGVTDLVADGETGVLVPAGDIDAMASALQDLVADEARREQMGAAGRARAEARFSTSTFIERFTDLYRQAVPSRRHGTGSG